LPVVDVAFPVRGTTISADHGYLLFSALSAAVPLEHGSQSEVAVHPISGRLVGSRLLALTPRSRLVLRVPHTRVPDLQRLAGKSLRLGDARLHLGVPRAYLLRSASRLASRLVVISGFTDPVQFLTAAQRQLERAGIEGTVSLPLRGRPRPVEGGLGSTDSYLRRTVSIKGRQIVGYALSVESLSDEDSIRLQERGIGGRRHMGCGVFVPARADG
jgi:CRISPR-associated protein Cas6